MQGHKHFAHKHCLFCVGYLLLGMRPVLKCGYKPSETLFEKNKFFLYEQLPTGDSFWVRDEDLSPFSLLVLGSCLV